MKAYPYSKLVYGNLIEKHKQVGINWGTQSSKVGLVYNWYNCLE